MFSDSMFVWTLVISLLLCKAVVINARHYSDYAVARMPQYDYEMAASQRAPVQFSEVDEYTESSSAAPAAANMDYKYVEETPETRKNRHVSKDSDTEYSWNRPLRNPRRQQRPLDSDNEQFDEEVIPKVKTNYRNPKYKAQGVNKKSRNYNSQSRRNRYTRKWDQSNRHIEESDEHIIEDDKPEFDRDREISDPTTKGRKRKPREKAMIKRNENDYGDAENEFRRQMQKIREQTLLGEPPGLVPGPQPVFKNEMPLRRPNVADEGGEKDFDYYDMKRLKKERDRARKLEQAYGRRFGSRVSWKPGPSFAPYPPTLEAEDPIATTAEGTQYTLTISWAPAYSATSQPEEAVKPTLTSPARRYLQTRTSRINKPSRLSTSEPTRYNTISWAPAYSDSSQTEERVKPTLTSPATTSYPHTRMSRIYKPNTLPTSEPTRSTIIMPKDDSTPVETTNAAETLSTYFDTVWTSDSDEPQTTAELTYNQALLRKKAMKELSLAEKSRLSILKKAERKDGFKFAVTQKPPVLLQVSTKMATVVMVEPPPDKNNPANMAAVMRAKEVSDDTPERIEKVKSLMRKKLIASARNFDDLTKDWDSLVCDYIDTDLLERAMSGAVAKKANFIYMLMWLTVCYIISITERFL